MPRQKDISGNRYGRLVVLTKCGHAVDKKGRKRELFWECRCDCGRIAKAKSSRLTAGVTRSCGCIRDESRQKHKNAALTHGMSYRPEYAAWKDMKRRCDKATFKQYKDYGGRGIGYSKRWEDFSAFYADMGARPKGHSLERKDNNKGYGPNNCRWATRSDQALNRRTAKLVTVGSETGALASFLPRETLAYKRAQDRIARGWEPEKAIRTPSKKGRK